MSRLSYQRSLIVAFDKVYIEERPKDAKVWYNWKEVKFEEGRKGKFVVQAEGSDKNIIRLYAALTIGWDITRQGLYHDNIPDLLRDMGKEIDSNSLLIGGGFLELDASRRTITVSGASGVLGNVPTFILQGALYVPDYTINVRGLDYYKAEVLHDFITEWYQIRGIEVRQKMSVSD